MPYSPLVTQILELSSTFTTWSWYSDLLRHSDLCLHRCQFVLPLSSAFFPGSWILFKMGMLILLIHYLLNSHWSRICHRRALLYFPQSTGRTSHHFNRTFQTATRQCPPIRTTWKYLGSSQTPIPPVYACFALPRCDDFSFVNPPPNRSPLTKTLLDSIFLKIFRSHGKL